MLKLPLKMEKRYLIRGRVQGVGYRWYTLGIAKKLKISGNVRNLPDNKVEVEAKADEKILELFKTFLKKGPVLSRVDEIKEFIEELHIKDGEFKIQ